LVRELFGSARLDTTKQSKKTGKFSGSGEALDGSRFTMMPRDFFDSSRFKAKGQN
jgi:hypothetical protein